MLASIEEQGKLTDELRAALTAADTKSRVEDIYLPYKPQATDQGADRARGWPRAARRCGCCADPTLIPEQAAAEFLGDDVADAAAALDGARHILIERAAEDAELVGAVREKFWADGSLRTTPCVGGGREKSLQGRSFATTSSSPNRWSAMPSHRVLAVMRGEKEQVLALNLDGGDDEVYHAMVAQTLGVDLTVEGCRRRRGWPPPSSWRGGSS